MTNVLVISRAPFATFTSSGKLFDALRDRCLVFLFSKEVSQVSSDHSYEHHYMDLTDSSGRLDAAIDVICTQHQITHIINISEQDVLPAARARSRLGLPGFQSSDVEAFRNKLVMKEVAAVAGLIVPRFTRADDRESTEALLKETGRIVVKPIYGYGSTNTFIIDDLVELHNMYELHGVHSHHFLAEEYVDADIHHLDCLVRDGIPYFSSLGRYDIPLIDHSRVEWMATRLSNRQSPVHIEAQKSLLAFLDKAGLQNGVFHFEFFATQHQITFLEVAARPSGGEICEAIQQTWGINLFEEFVNLQLGLPPTWIDLPERYAACVWRMSVEEGTVSIIKGVEACLSEHVSVNMHCQAGKNVSISQHCGDSLATFLVSGNDARTIDCAIEDLHEQVRITII